MEWDVEIWNILIYLKNDAFNYTHTVFRATRTGQNSVDITILIRFLK